jgi:hypothetical protein
MTELSGNLLDAYETAAAGIPMNGRGGFRTCDLSRVKRALSH